MECLIAYPIISPQEPATLREKGTSQVGMGTGGRGGLVICHLVGFSFFLCVLTAEDCKVNPCSGLELVTSRLAGVT